MQCWAARVRTLGFEAGAEQRESPMGSRLPSVLEDRPTWTKAQRDSDGWVGAQSWGASGQPPGWGAGAESLQTQAEQKFQSLVVKWPLSGRSQTKRSLIWTGSITKKVPILKVRILPQGTLGPNPTGSACHKIDIMQDCQEAAGETGAALRTAGAPPCQSEVL